MKRRIGIGCAAIVTVVCTAGVSAQDRPSSTTRSQPGQNAITVVGCLAQGNQTGTTGTTGSTST